MLGSRGPHVLREFWNQVSESYWFRDHPVSKEPSLLPFSIPIRHHGDDITFRTLTGGKLCVTSLHGELSEMDSLSSRLLSFVTWDAKLESGTTLKDIFVVFAWSLKQAWLGRWPSTDHLGSELAQVKGNAPGVIRFAHRGRALAGPYRFCYSGGLGDWVWHDKLYHPVWHGHSHNYCCNRDLASRVHQCYSFTDFQDFAGWRATAISNAEFLAAVLQEDWHPLF